MCVCDLGVCACARETLGLWGQTYLGSVPPLALPSGFGFLFCESENRGILLPHSIVGRIKWIKRIRLEKSSTFFLKKSVEIHLIRENPCLNLAPKRDWRGV